MTIGPEDQSCRWCTHHWQTEMVHPHKWCCEEGTTVPLQPQEAEEIWLVTQNPDKRLQMHNWEHPVGLNHSLVQKLHRPQPQGSPEGGAVCTTHHRGQTTCPPWHLQHPMSQGGQQDNQGQQPPEPLPVHTATIQKARSVQMHQSGDRETEKTLIFQGHQTAKQLSLTQRGCCLQRDSLVTLNNATLIMFTYPTLLISYVYTVLYTIYCILPMPFGHHSFIYFYVHIRIHSFTLVCV